MKVSKVDVTRVKGRMNGRPATSPARGSPLNDPGSKTPAGSGRLFVVGVPIGHPDDLTFRARRILQRVDLIASEDPQATQRLLAHYRITVPVTTYFAGNRGEKTAVLLQQLAEGRNIALVTDAGTPAVFDPGAYVIRAAHRAGLPVVPVPLRSPDPDSRLDLQEILHRIYDAAGYEKYIYEGRPDPPLGPEEASWARPYLPAEHPL